MHVIYIFKRLLCLTLLLLACAGCTAANDKETRQIKATIMRYNQLLADGYRSLNMTALQEVATEEQSAKLYFHMAAISEGKLKMDSSLKNLKYIKLDFSKSDEAAVETRETWDFTHVNMSTGKKFAEERDFIYEMGYVLKKADNRWIITNVNTVNGTSTNSVIPWPEIDRKGNKTYTHGKLPDNLKPAAHP